MKVKVISLPYIFQFCMFCALQATISGERLQDHWSSGIKNEIKIKKLCDRSYSFWILFNKTPSYCIC